MCIRDRRDDHLFVGGVDMVELAREQGTALYVMDEQDMRTRMETYLHAFRSRYANADIVYAVSYTHLDVYKRQPLECPPTIRRFGSLNATASR